MNIKRLNLVDLRLGYCIFVMLLCIVSGFYFLSGSKAQSVRSEIVSEKQSNPLPDDLDKSFARLIEIAREKGTARVIVGLRMDFTPVGDLNPAERERQQTNIRQVQSDLLESLSGYNVREVKQFEYIPYLAAVVDAAALEKMRQDPQIISLQEDEAVAPTLAESVPLVGAPAAWTAGFTGSGWSVAVLDTGVDKFHSFLSGKVISEACYSSNTAAATTVCPGGVTSSTATGSGVNCSLSVSGCNHGTHVAGIAAGTNGSNLHGVARGGNVIAVQVFSRFGNQADCGSATAPCARSYTSDQILGLERVFALRTTTNIAAVNMSLGGGNFTSNCDSDSRKPAIDNLRSVGIATVISSGNESLTNAIGAPACISSAISVGSTGDGSSGATVNVVSSFSNSSSFLSLLAPGQWINSSVPGGSFSNIAGTSMAAPHVAGGWAVLKHKKPTATVTEILNAFTSTGLQITDNRNGIVKPRIRVDAALAAINTGCGSTPISFGQTANGTLSTSDCVLSGTTRYVDVYTFSGTAGQQIAVTMNSTAFDTYLYLANSSNQVLIENDDGGGGTNSRIPPNSGFFTLPATGTYSIWASSYFEGSTGAYSLTLTTNAPNACDQLTPIALNQTIGGVLTTSDCLVGGNWYTDKYSFSGTAGQQIVISMNSSAVDSFLLLYTSGGQFLTSDNDGGGGLNARIPPGTGSFTLPATGNYIIEASTNVGFQTGSYTVALTPGVVNPLTHRQFDFDGDGKTDVAIYRPSNGQWWINRSSNGSTFAATFGISTDKIVPADYTGDGRTDIAVWRPSTREWLVLRSENFTYYGFVYGLSVDIPTPGYFDADNKADVAVFRPTTGVWYIRRSTDNGDTTHGFGISGDIPVVGDYDGDSLDDVAIYRQSNGQWWLKRSTAGVIAYQFGAGGDIPVVGDFTGDGKADAVFWRPSLGRWFILRSENQSYFENNFGSNGDIPLSGDFTGDGRSDYAVFRPSTNTWFIQNVLTQTFGQAGDKPVPSAFVP